MRIYSIIFLFSCFWLSTLIRFDVDWNCDLFFFQILSVHCLVFSFFLWKTEVSVACSRWTIFRYLEAIINNWYHEFFEFLILFRLFIYCKTSFDVTFSIASLNFHINVCMLSKAYDTLFASSRTLFFIKKPLKTGLLRIKPSIVFGTILIDTIRTIE